jgi:hypothetical protein
MRIDENEFQVVYDDQRHVLYFTGSLRMNNLAEFDKIKKFMLEAYDLEAPELTLDYTKLEFMNSAGISTLCKFIFDIKDRAPYKPLSIIGNENILWQLKSFENLKKIWDRIDLRFVGAP